MGRCNLCSNRISSYAAAQCDCGMSFVCDACRTAHFCTDCRSICDVCATLTSCSRCSSLFCKGCLRKCPGCHDKICYFCSPKHFEDKCRVCGYATCFKYNNPNTKVCLKCE